MLVASADFKVFFKGHIQQAAAGAVAAAEAAVSVAVAAVAAAETASAVAVERMHHKRGTPEQAAASKPRHAMTSHNLVPPVHHRSQKGTT